MKKFAMGSLMVLVVFALFACMEKAHYTIAFESNGGSLIEPIFTDGRSVVILPESPSKPGSHFEGWYYDDETFDLPFDPEAFLHRPRSESFTVYAKWSMITYTVTYQHNGGTGIEEVDALHGTTIVLPASSKDNHKFFGWFLDEIFTLPYDETMAVLDSITLYAKWEPYVPVVTNFDPAGGAWPGTIIETFDPDLLMTIASLNDDTGFTLTLIDKTQTTYRWYYKLFVAYDEIFKAYRVVAIDAATAGIATLNISDYDFVIGLHDNHQDAELKSTFISLASSIETLGMFLVFDAPPSGYESGALEVELYAVDVSLLQYTSLVDTDEVLPIPIKQGYRFLGWSDGDTLFTVFPGYSESEIDETLTVVAVWQSHTTLEFTLAMDTYFEETIENAIVFPLVYGDFSITWQSDSPEILSNEGIFYRPYVPTQVTLHATLTADTLIETLTFTLTAGGYKSLDTPIASSYIYRSFHLVNDAFFETLDIINCAFITADHNANLFGATFLNNVAEHIIPRAREHGNWVILSIAPESAWTTIAASASLRNTFADNIVAMINTYGFDGVDIDWEFPKNDTESAQFTLLMQTVFTKVKANNPHHLVTAALGAGQWQPPRYDLHNSAPYIDYINMMAYSMTSSNGYYQNALFRSTTNHHPTFSAGRTLTSCSIAESIAIYRDSFNIPLEKIIVGVAFYGIKQGRTYDATTGTWSAWSRLHSVFYHTIVNQYLNHPDYTVYYDEIAQVPYIVKNDGTEFISFDNPMSILAKSDYIIAEGLGGMMYWEHGADTTGALLAAMRIGLGK